MWPTLSPEHAPHSLAEAGAAVAKGSGVIIAATSGALVWLDELGGNVGTYGGVFAVVAGLTSLAVWVIRTVAATYATRAQVLDDANEHADLDRAAAVTELRDAWSTVRSELDDALAYSRARATELAARVSELERLVAELETENARLTAATDRRQV